MFNRIKTLPLRVRHTFYYDVKAAALFGIFGGSFLPFVAIVGRKIGATEFQISLLTAAPYIATAFAIFWTEDILGKGRVWYVVWPNVVGRAFLFSMLFVASPFAYTLVVFIYMIITAIPFPSYASVMKTNYPDEARGRLMSYVRVGSACFWIVASIITGWILEKNTYNYRYIFPVAAIFGILSALEFGRIKVRLEKKKKQRLEALSHLTAPLKNKPFLKFIIIYSIFEFGLLLWLPLYPLILVDKVHISNIATGIFGAIYSGMWLLGFFFWGRFIDRHTLSNSLKLFFIVTAFIPLIYLLTHNIWFLAIAQGIAGITFAAIELIGYVVITRMSHHRETPRYMAVYAVFGGVRGITAPFLGPVIMNNFSAEAAIALSLLLMAVAFLSISFMKGE